MDKNTKIETTKGREWREFFINLIMVDNVKIFAMATPE